MPGPLTPRLKCTVCGDDDSDRPYTNLGGLSPVGAADCSMLPTIGPCLAPPNGRGTTRPCGSLSLLFRPPPPHLPPRTRSCNRRQACRRHFLKKKNNTYEGKQRPHLETAERLQATGDGYYPRGTALRPPRRQALTPLARPRLGGGGGEKVCGPRRPTLPPRAHVAMCDCVWVKPYTHTQRVVQRLLSTTP